MKKKLLAIIVCAAFACCLAMVGCSNGSNGSGGEQGSTGEQGGTEAQSTETETKAGMPNPWSDVATAEDAAKGAGFDEFAVPVEGTIQDMKMVSAPTFRCMEGLAEANYEFGASSICIRKGKPEVASEGSDVSGVYDTYAKTWTVKVGDIDVTCQGNVDGQSIKTLWSSGGYDYSIYAMGLGGDENFGLTNETVTTLVGQIK